MLRLVFKQSIFQFFIFVIDLNVFLIGFCRFFFIKIVFFIKNLKNKCVLVYIYMFIYFIEGEGVKLEFQFSFMKYIVYMEIEG